MPSSFRRPRVSSRMPSRSRLSRPEKGSSISMTEGRGARARASATRCCSPPDNSCGKLSMWRERWTRSRSSPTRARCSARGPARPKATLSATDRCGNSAKSWNISPTERRSGGTETRGPSTSRPSTVMVPSSGVSTPASMRRVVDLPQPEGPSRQKISPAAMRSEMPSTTRRPAKRRTRPWASRRGAARGAAWGMGWNSRGFRSGSGASTPAAAAQARRVGRGIGVASWWHRGGSAPAPVRRGRAAGPGLGRARPLAGPGGGARCGSAVGVRSWR